MRKMATERQLWVEEEQVPQLRSQMRVSSLCWGVASGKNMESCVASAYR